MEAYLHPICPKCREHMVSYSSQMFPSQWWTMYICPHCGYALPQAIQGKPNETK